jgi:hypothetical protein
MATKKMKLQPKVDSAREKLNKAKTDKLTLDRDVLDARRELDLAEKNLKQKQEEATNTVKKQEGDQKNCRDEALKGVVAKLQENPEVLNQLFNLASLKVALKATQDSPDKGKYNTFEQLTVAKISELDAAVKKLEGAGANNQALLDLYQRHGKIFDVKTLKTQSEKFKDAKYSQANGTTYAKRLLNENASAFLLLTANDEAMKKRAAEKDATAITNLDVAAVWAVEKIRVAASQKNNDYKIGGVKGNHLNLSTRVYRLLGDASAEKDKIQSTIQATSKNLNDTVKTAFNGVKDTLRKCLLKATNDCANCADKGVGEFETGQLNDALMGLVETANTANDVQMDKDLRKTTGTLKFDFSKLIDLKK